MSLIVICEDLIENVLCFRPCFIQKVPNEVLVSIFHFLKPQEVLQNLALVCNRWQHVIRSTLYWNQANVNMSEGILVWRRAPVIGHLRIEATNRTEIHQLKKRLIGAYPDKVLALTIQSNDIEFVSCVLERYRVSIKTLHVVVSLHTVMSVT